MILAEAWDKLNLAATQWFCGSKDEDGQGLDSPPNCNTQDADYHPTPKLNGLPLIRAKIVCKGQHSRGQNLPQAGKELTDDSKILPHHIYTCRDNENSSIVISDLPNKVFCLLILRNINPLYNAIKAEQSQLY